MEGRQPIYRVRVEGEFSSSHQLRNYGGKCESLHGHNFRVQVEVEGSGLDPETGILVDFKDIRGQLQQILSELDHAHLNELPAFRRENPSSENLARYIYQRLEQALSMWSVSLRKVSVFEKEGSRATYRET